MTKTKSLQKLMLSAVLGVALVAGAPFAHAQNAAKPANDASLDGATKSEPSISDAEIREIINRMHPESRLILFELDPELAQHLQEQFRADSRITVLNADAANLCEELGKRGHTHCDYIVSGIPFSILDPEKKRDLLRRTFDSLAPQDHSAFIIYQVTNELVGHCRHFPRRPTEHAVMAAPHTT